MASESQPHTHVLVSDQPIRVEKSGGDPRVRYQQCIVVTDAFAELTAAGVKVFNVLLKHVNGKLLRAEGRLICWPKPQTLALESRLSWRSVRRGLECLSRNGIMRHVCHPASPRLDHKAIELQWCDGHPMQGPSVNTIESRTELSKKPDRIVQQAGQNCPRLKGITSGLNQRNETARAPMPLAAPPKPQGGPSEIAKLLAVNGIHDTDALLAELADPPLKIEYVRGVLANYRGRKLRSYSGAVVAHLRKRTPLEPSLFEQSVASLPECEREQAAAEMQRMAELAARDRDDLARIVEMEDGELRGLMDAAVSQQPADSPLRRIWRKKTLAQMRDPKECLTLRRAVAERMQLLKENRG